MSIATSLLSQKSYTISGYIEDAATGERLIGCIVKDADDNNLITTSNDFGFYSLKIHKNKIKLKVIYVGYQKFEKEFSLHQDTTVDITLKLENEIQKVVVSTDRMNVQSTQMSKINVPIEKIQNLPVIFGEVDLLKTLQLMPGVQSGTEGSNGIYVRGGGPDENLILLDGVPVYNVSHMFGFFSVFNTAAIKNVTLYKGGFPAHYGGRLSSVIDVTMKDGNMKKFDGEVSIGIIASKFTIEGPIKKNKTSFIISARRTYIDLLAAPLIKIFAQHKDTEPNGDTYIDKPFGGYFFYDFNAKITHNLSSKDRIFLSLYAGKDFAFFNDNTSGTNSGYPFKENQDFKLNWGNTIASIRWNHTFSKNLFMNTLLTHSNFNFGLKYAGSSFYQDSSSKYSENYKAGYLSGINDDALSVNFDYIPNVKHRIKFGINAIYHTFLPGKIDFSMNISEPKIKFDTTFGSQKLYAPELAIYAEDNIKLNNWLKFNVGIRISSFKVRDTLFWHPEPRISMRILLSKNFSVKLSYAEMMQYLHFLTNNTIGLPVDLWMPATNIIVPENSKQTALGISWLIKNKITLSAEIFYKDMNNLIEFKDGESIFSSPGEGGMGEVWENKVSQGYGNSYGFELFIQKNYGKLTGWISYTFAHSNRIFPDINNGKMFPFKYDRRHDISIVAMYKLNKNINFGLTWVFGSGTPITLKKAEFFGINGPNGYEQNGNHITFMGDSYYGGRNSYRLPSYQRLDISVNISKQKKHGTRTWSLGVYNLYNHINPFFVTYYRGRRHWENGKFIDNNKTYLRIISIFQVMPIISYKFVW